MVSVNSNRLLVDMCLLAWRSSWHRLPRVEIRREALEIVLITMRVVPLFILHRQAVMVLGLVTWLGSVYHGVSFRASSCNRHLVAMMSSILHWSTAVGKTTRALRGIVLVN